MSRLLNSIARRYRHQGWHVYSNNLSGYKSYTDNWNGVPPDLICVRKKKICAVCIETSATLESQNIPDKWKSILENNVKLVIIVKSNDSQSKAKTIARENRIKVTIQAMKKAHRRNPHYGANPFLNSSGTDWIIVLVVAFVFLGFLIFFFPTIIAQFKMKDFYQPFDTERQTEYKKKMEDNLKGKSAEEIKAITRKERDKADQMKKRLEKMNRK